ncbi:MAG: hypothetical protein AXW15_02340 [Neptuniibacter sp. Phe_28]|jgi:hypothetical protein|nr:MAG: hypothetical protein AXW15_02340 [Neptuniibacter sp. Phe_28]
MNVIVNTKQMHSYRVLSDSTMRRLSLAQCDLIDKADATNDPELKSLVWKFAEVLRLIDWGDKFIMAHSEPLKKPEKHMKMRQRFINEISHRPAL